MTLGPASLGTSIFDLPEKQSADRAPAAPPQPRTPTTDRGTIYDCGKHGWLTAGQIARIAGTSKTAIYKRIKAKVRGEALCARRWANQSNVRRDSPPRRHSLALALRIAHLFPDRLPEIHEIQQLRTMSKQNAQVWRQAIATARKDAGL